jgi:enoyl-[acyl-carrier protein] reductase/trans-2-enoyl-CoA reductase (NAD+)
VRVNLEVFKKLPLGGTDRRSIVSGLAAHGPLAARELLAAQLGRVCPRGAALPNDTAVIVLGGSNGITRAVAIELLFGARAAVFGVHYDSDKMQIGVHHVAALCQRAASDGLTARFWNNDATKPSVADEVIAEIKGKYRAVHLINGIAAGATKRYVEHGPTKVKDIDVAFDPILQVPDFSRPENIRRVGLVEVEVATDTDIERTNRFMGTSSLVWAEALASAGLLVAGQSIVAFCDYDFEPDDPVYAMGPLAGAKKLQRETMTQIRDRFGAKTVRICYPAVATTALGAIPGGLLMYGLSAQILKERGQYQDVMDLGAATMKLFEPSFASDILRLDEAYRAALPEFHRRKDALGPENLHAVFSALYAP